MQESIGRRIAQRRLAKGMTQERLAREMGVSAQAVSKWENDLNYPDVTLLAPLARLLDTTVDELLTGATPSADVSASAGTPAEGAADAPAASETRSAAASEPAAAATPTAADPTSRPSTASKNAWVHIQVTGGREGDNVDVSIPLSIVKFAANVALAQPAIANNTALEGFDLEAILRAIEEGELGTIVDVTDHDEGERVRIWVG